MSIARIGSSTADFTALPISKVGSTMKSQRIAQIGDRTMGRMLDKRGIEIMRGDVVKVYHFTAALRRKRHYMIKQALGEKNGRMEFSSLDFGAHSYSEAMNDEPHRDYEIIQSLDPNFEHRPRFAQSSNPDKAA